MPRTLLLIFLSPSSRPNNQHLNRQTKPEQQLQQPVQPELSEPLPKKRKKGSGNNNTDLSYFTKSNLKIYELTGHNDLVCCVDIPSAPAPFFVSGSRDTTVKLWNLQSMSEIHSFGGHTDAVTGLIIRRISTISASLADLFRLNSNDYLIISSSSDCCIKYWSVNERRLVKSIYTFNPVKSISLVVVNCADSSDAPEVYVAAVSSGGKLELYEMNPECDKPLISVIAFDHAITAVYSRANKIIVGSSEGRIRLYYLSQKSLHLLFDTEPGSISAHKRRPFPTRPIHSIILLSNDAILYCDEGSNIKQLIWKEGEMVKVVNNTQSFGYTDALALSTDSKYIYSTAYNLDEGIGSLNVRCSSSADMSSSSDSARATGTTTAHSSSTPTPTPPPPRRPSYLIPYVCSLCEANPDESTRILSIAVSNSSSSSSNSSSSSGGADLGGVIVPPPPLIVTGGYRLLVWSPPPPQSQPVYHHQPDVAASSVDVTVNRVLSSCTSSSAIDTDCSESEFSSDERDSGGEESDSAAGTAAGLTYEQRRLERYHRLKRIEQEEEARAAGGSWCTIL